MQCARPVLRIERSPPAAVTDEVVRSRAYQLYEARGGEPGADLDDWLRAEPELREPANGTDKQSA